MFFLGGGLEFPRVFFWGGRHAWHPTTTRPGAWNCETCPLVFPVKWKNDTWDIFPEIDLDLSIESNVHKHIYIHFFHISYTYTCRYIYIHIYVYAVNVNTYHLTSHDFFKKQYFFFIARLDDMFTTLVETIGFFNGWFFLRTSRQVRSTAGQHRVWVVSWVMGLCHLTCPTDIDEYATC